MTSHAHDAHVHMPHGDGTGGYHPHESPWTMLVPLGVLSLGAVFAGFVFHHAFIEDAGILERRGRLQRASDARDARGAAVGEADGAVAVMLIGFGDRLARLHHATPRSRPSSPSSSASVYRFLYNKWYFDELYDFLFVKPAFWLGRLFWKRGRRRR